MSWKSLLPEYQVPKTIDQLVRSGVLVDRTWANDIVPHFERDFLDSSTLVLWVDHPDPEKRATPDGPRYGIEIYQKYETPKTVFGSNDLSETLRELPKIIRTRGPMRLV